MVLDSPKNNCNNCNCNAFVKKSPNFEKKSINTCISQKKVVTLYRN